MFLVRFIRQDPQPVEEYFYQSRAAAMEHFHLFKNDDSGLYRRIDLLDLKEEDLDQEQLIDSIDLSEVPTLHTAETNEDLSPSYHGEECLYNGEHAGYEIACDECDFYLECFPDWKEQMQKI